MNDTILEDERNIDTIRQNESDLSKKRQIDCINIWMVYIDKNYKKEKKNVYKD